MCYGLSGVRTELKILWSGRPEPEIVTNSDVVDRAGAGGSTLICSLFYIENQIDNEKDIFLYIAKHKPVKLLKCIQKPCFLFLVESCVKVQQIPTSA